MFLLELHYVLPNEGDFMDMVEFLQENLDEIILRYDRICRQTIKSFLD